MDNKYCSQCCGITTPRTRQTIYTKGTNDISCKHENCCQDNEEKNITARRVNKVRRHNYVNIDMKKKITDKLMRSNHNFSQYDEMPMNTQHSLSLYPQNIALSEQSSMKEAMLYRSVYLCLLSFSFGNRYLAKQ